jgi:hypothetical protein
MRNGLCHVALYKNCMKCPDVLHCKDALFGIEEVKRMDIEWYHRAKWHTDKVKRKLSNV